MRYNQPQSGPIRVAETWLDKHLKFALVPAAGYFNSASQKPPLQVSGPLSRAASTSGQTVEPGTRAEFPANIDATKGLTIISIWRARTGGNYFGADGTPVLASTRNSINQGWSWGHSTAIGGGATGNLINQSITFQGVAQYNEANNTIEAFVDTPVACRYDPATGLISWFRFGSKSSPDTVAGTPSMGDKLVIGAQGDFPSNISPWLDRYAAILIFETPLSDAAIKQVSSSTQALWQVFKAPQRQLFAVAAASGNNLVPGVGPLVFNGFPPTVSQPQTVSPGLGAITVTGYAPSVSQSVSLTPAPGALVLAGYAPTVTQPKIITPGAGALTITGFAPTVSQISTISPLPGALVINGYAPTVSQPRTITPGAGQMVITGYAPSISQVYFVAPQVFATTIMSAHAIDASVPALSGAINATTTMRGRFDASTIISAHPINGTGSLSAKAINGTANLL